MWCEINFADIDANPLHYYHYLRLNGELIDNVVIPEGTSAIKAYAFYQCNNLTSIFIPNSVTTIGTDSFNKCPNLKTVTLGNSITSIGKWAFSSCNNLTSVTCKAIVPPVANSDSFSCNNQATLSVPKASIETYQTTTPWSSFKTIVGCLFGDVDGDGRVSIDDLTELINLLLTNGEADDVADVDGDGRVIIDDVAALINILLNNH